MTTGYDRLDLEVHVSLDGSGDFLGSDDRLFKVKADTGVTLDEGRDGAQQLNPPKITAGDFDLSDPLGVYTPTNAGSPYYQRLLPGKPMRYQAKHGDRQLYRSHIPYRSHVYYRGKGVWPLARHVLDDLDPDPTVGNRRVKVSTLGWETLLARAVVSIPVMSTPLVSECFTAYLDAVGWPLDKRAISVSDTRLLFYYADERHPWDGMLELLAAEGPGMFGVRRDGTFYFENRNFRSTATRSTVNQATFYDRIDGQRTRYRAHSLYRSHRPYRGRINGLVHTGLKPLNPLKNILNRATFTTRRRALAVSPSVIWSLGADLDLSSAASRTLIVKPSDPFQNAITPTSPTDYTVAGGTVSVSLSAASGLVAFVTVTKTGGSPIVSGLQLRAQPLTVVGETTVQNTIDASASIAKYSPIPGQNIPITLPIQGWAEIDAAQAEAVCNSWVLRQQELRPLVSFTIVGNDAAHLERILRLRPSDRITLIDAHLGLSDDFWVNAMQLRIADARGSTVELAVLAEACDTVSGAVWDVDRWDSGVWGV